MGNEIPTRSRELVRERDGDTCQRCGNGRALAWHHRRRRAVKGHFQHCPCIGIQLCTTCHRWAHANPAAAQEVGMIVPPHVEDPSTIPVRTYAGWVLNYCDGGSEYTEPPRQ